MSWPGGNFLKKNYEKSKKEIFELFFLTNIKADQFILQLSIQNIIIMETQFIVRGKKNIESILVLLYRVLQYIVIEFLFT